MPGTLECRKGCGKKFSHEGWRAKHEEGCDGEPKKRGAAVTNEIPRKPRKAKSAARNASAIIPEAISELQARRAHLQEQILELDNAIRVLQELNSK